MPLFMDVHRLDGPVSIDDVAKAHLADLQTQGRFDVRYLRYWVDEGQGRIFCLAEAPSADAAPAPSTGRRTASSQTRSSRSRRAAGRSTCRRARASPPGVTSKRSDRWPRHTAPCRQWRRSRRAACAAFQPHIPWAPAPGGVAAEQR